ncbi:MAG: hypothetical protein ACOC0N_08215 [Chroococcales cyanobacterium]
MSYTEPRENYVAESATVNPVVNYHDRVRWGPIVAGLFITIASQLVLSALALGFGLGTGLDATGVGIWSIINIFVSLLIGGWVMARSCGPMNKKTAMLNGAILWGLALGVSSWLVASGVTGAFGLAFSTAGSVAGGLGAGGQLGDLPNTGVDPNQIPQRAAALTGEAAGAAWGFVIGSLLALASAIIGAVIGARSRNHHTGV